MTRVYCARYQEARLLAKSESHVSQDQAGVCAPVIAAGARKVERERNSAEKDTWCSQIQKQIKAQKLENSLPAKFMGHGLVEKIKNFCRETQLLAADPEADRGAEAGKLAAGQDAGAEEEGADRGTAGADCQVGGSREKPGGSCGRQGSCHPEEGGRRGVDARC